MRIIILGAGSFAREVTDLTSDLGWEVVAYVVNKNAGRECTPVYNILDAPQHVFPPHAFPLFVPGFISPERERLFKGMIVRGFEPVSIVHPSTLLSKAVVIWPGCVVNRGVVISTGVVLNSGTIVNRGATIGHDCTLLPFSTVGPGANLAGGVTIGTGATVGMGANIREGVRVGARATVGMGAVVLCDVPDGETWWGVPAKRVK